MTVLPKSIFFFKINFMITNYNPFLLQVRFVTNAWMNTQQTSEVGVVCRVWILLCTQQMLEMGVAVLLL